MWRLTNTVASFAPRETIVSLYDLIVGFILRLMQISRHTADTSAGSMSVLSLECVDKLDFLFFFEPSI